MSADWAILLFLCGAAGGALGGCLGIGGGVIMMPVLRLGLGSSLRP